ncbi:hypothetical protein EDB19DRAFT_245472 [Suillus lakei]|nr:hypothetical protein EDB19DRAFT_245472 [Suillus lakei]
MHKPQQEHIELGRITDHDSHHVHNANQLKDKYVVDSAFTCPSYYLCLFGTSGERVALAITAKAPIVAAIGVTAGGGASVGWRTNTQQGFHRTGFSKEGEYCFTPLYTLKRRPKWFEPRQFCGEQEHPGTGKPPTEKQSPGCVTDFRPKGIFSDNCPGGLTVSRHGSLLMRMEMGISCAKMYVGLRPPICGVGPFSILVKCRE